MNFLPNGVAISIPLPFPIFGQTSLAIYWYGILIVAGAIAGAFLATIEAKRRGLDADHVWNALLFALIFGVIGARIYHIISDVAQGDQIGYFSKDWVTNLLTVINPRTGGLGIFGAIAGGIFGLWIYCRLARLKFWQWVDVAVPGLALGQAIGRWGNFFNQELYGWPTTLPWGIPIDAAHRAGTQFAGNPDTVRYHPTFLYESLAMLVVTGLLLYIGRRAKNLRTGDMFLLYGMSYGLVRFFTEMERPDAWTISGVPTAQIISIAAFVICGVWFAYRHTGAASQTQEVRAAQRRRARRRTGAQYRAQLAASRAGAGGESTKPAGEPSVETPVHENADAESTSEDKTEG